MPPSTERPPSPGRNGRPSTPGQEEGPPPAARAGQQPRNGTQARRAGRGDGETAGRAHGDDPQERTTQVRRVERRTPPSQADDEKRRTDRRNPADDEKRAGCADRTSRRARADNRSERSSRNDGAAASSTTATRSAAADAETSVEATTRVQRIDETLTRLTAAHAGLTLGMTDDEPAETDAAPSRRRPNLLRLAALAVAVVILVTAGVGWSAQRWLAAAVPSAAALDPGSGAIVDAPAQVGDENVLLVATDRTATAGAATRPDTVVVAHLPAGNGPMTVLAIPADLEISRPPCERYEAASGTYTTDTVPAQARTQLTSALDLGGPRCATRAVQQLTGLAITQYVGLDLARLGDAVDALSGVQFCTPRAVVDTALGPVVPNPGTITLDARQATAFVRAASVADDPASGRGRIERQQEVLAAVLGPALSGLGLLDLPRVAALRPALGHILTTDAADLDQVLALSRSLRDLGASGLTFTAVPTDPDPAGQGSVLRSTDAAVVFDALRTDAPLPATATDGAHGPRPTDLTVQVANASDRPGLAGKISDTLRGLGFGIGEVTNAAQPTPQTLIRYSPDQTAAAQLLAATVPAATTVPDPGATGVLQLVLGRSFDGVVRAPTTAPAASTDPAPSPSPAPVTCR